MKVYKLPIGGSTLYVEDLQGALMHLEPELDNLELGETFVIKVIEMSEEEFAALPEFD
ncbi:hypothetical protein [Rufibacter latericius]|uniref:hypothetical protein n=1 Tax=Rufibacter latericius TaxID=2487040 RepID=UPI001403CE4E|nr:hypothetical protein [Rufibacter latericius]